MAVLGYVYTLGKQTSRSPELCTAAQNATGARFLEVQIGPRVLVYDWDPLVACVKCQKRAKIWWEEQEEYEKVKTGKRGNSDYDVFPPRELQVALGNIVTLRTLK